MSAVHQHRNILPTASPFLSNKTEVCGFLRHFLSWFSHYSLFEAFFRFHHSIIITFKRFMCLPTANNNCGRRLCLWNLQFSRNEVFSYYYIYINLNFSSYVNNTKSYISHIFTWMHSYSYFPIIVTFTLWCTNIFHIIPINLSSTYILNF